MNARRRALAAAAFAAWTWFGPAAAADESAAWSALKRGGHVLLIRHAQTTTGIGDPPGFRLDDCATQRNLSEAGRAQSQELGRRLREAGVEASVVLSSQWCRCVDTAQLAFGRYERWTPLNSFFGSRSTEGAQTAQVRDRIRGWNGPGTLALVTHQVNISALTGEAAAMGEALVLAPGGSAGFVVIGRIPF